MEQILKLIVENGMFVVLMGYFIYKDYKFNQDIIDVLSEVKQSLSSLRDVIAMLSNK